MAATAAEASQVRTATPTPEALEFVSFCHNHGVGPTPIRRGSRRSWRGEVVDNIVGHGWTFDVDAEDSMTCPRLCVWEDGTLAIVTGAGSGPYSLRETVDPADLSRLVGSWRGSLADILAKAASNILIKKENGELYPPY